MVQTPFIELGKDRLQTHSQRSEPIVDALRIVVEGPSIDQPMGFQRPELLDQDFLREAGNLVLKLA